VGADHLTSRNLLPKARIVAIRPFFWATAAPARLDVLAAVIRTAVTSVGGTYLDIGSPLTGKPEDMSADQVHPNDAGYAALAAAVEKAYTAAR
jgi:acyl-CoA thioesterase I